MTDTLHALRARATVPAPRLPLRGLRNRSRPSPGLLPAAVLAVVTAAALRLHEVPLGDTALFAAHVGLVVTLPGTLLWRALCGGARHLPVELAAGTALGYTMEILAYLPARALGMPRYFLLWPLLTIVAFLGVPRLRRHWRPGRRDRVPLWWASAVSALLGCVVLWSCRTHFPFHGLSWPGNATPNLDLTYHLALVGELRHHLPPTTPWVHGQPLLYHWFVYAEMAATSWTTGLEPQTLLYRLSPLPMTAASVVLVAELARRLTGRWWPGVAALLASYLLVAPSPLPGLISVDPDLAQLRTSIWVSPTQTLGALLFGAALLLVIDVLYGRGGPRWIPLVLVLTALMGAKATYLPLLVAGLGAVVLLAPVTGRRPAVRAAALIVLCMALLCFAQFVLYGGSSQGMSIDPPAALRYLALRVLPGRTPAPEAATVVTLVVLGWACVWAGLAGLPRRGLLFDPAITLLLGIGLAGTVAMLLLSQPGGSQLWFSRSSSTYLMVASMCGLSALLKVRRRRPAHLTGRSAVALGIAAVTGTGVALVCRAAMGSGETATGARQAAGAASRTVSQTVPQAVSHAVPATGVQPGPVVAFIVLLTAAGCAACVLGPLLRRWTGSGDVAAAAVVVLFMALALPASAAWHLSTLRSRPQLPQVVSPGALAAGRWLREHSSASDLVATNAHCSQPQPPCITLHFWVSGFAERRVLVEGWGYTAASNRRAMDFRGRYTTVPFWDRRLLEDNDAAFRRPSAATVGLLRSRHHIRWLFADRRVPGLSPRLGEFATLRFRRGDCSVYEITD